MLSGSSLTPKTDGTDRDVTTLPRFSSSNDNSVSIHVRDGLASSKNRGEAFLLSRFHTFTERAKFLADTRKEKREALVDELLGRKEFTEMWVMKGAELMQIRTFNNGPQQVSYKAALNYDQWLRERIAGESLVCKKRRQHRVVAFQRGWHRRSGG